MNFSPSHVRRLNAFHSFSQKPKVLRKLIQNQFKKVLNLDEVQCMTKFIEIVDEIIHYKTETYKCEFKVGFVVVPAITRKMNFLKWQIAILRRLPFFLRRFSFTTSRCN